MSRARLFRGYKGAPDEIGRLDLTGGKLDVVKLTDNGTPKMLLRFTKAGVLVEASLDLRAAQDYTREVGEVLAWIAIGGHDDR